jgi:hypothetical protein
VQVATIVRRAEWAMAEAASCGWEAVEICCACALYAAACSPALLGCVYFLQRGSTCKKVALVLYRLTLMRGQQRAIYNRHSTTMPKGINNCLNKHEAVLAAMLCTVAKGK